MNSLSRGMLITFATLLFASCAKDPEQRPSEKDYSRIRKSSSLSPRTLCVFLDGTANDYDSHTNVRRLYELVSARRDPKVLCYYDHGVGSNELPISGMIGGAGFSKNVSQAYTFLRQYYSKERGDRIFMFGYSRGARQVQVLCDLLATCGLAPASGTTSNFRTGDPSLTEARKILLAYKKNREKRARGESVYSIRGCEKWVRPEVELVGNFDCVESMANNVWRNIAHWNLKQGAYQDHAYYTYVIPGNVKESYHAFSLDEKRGLYEGIEWVKPSRTRPGQIIEEVWFPGSHGDVGGGYQNSQSLSAFSLNWIISKLDKHGLIPGGIRVHTEILTPGTDSSEFPVAGKVLGFFRDEKPRVHQLWNDTKEDPKFPGSLAKAIREKVVPLVHQSVIDRMESNPIVNADGNSPGESIFYRPELFHEYYLPRPTPENKDYLAVDFKRLRSAIQVVPMTREEKSRY